MTVTTPSFPILTFDVNKLTPSFGYVFDGRWLDPYESVVSILWKFVWMNRLAGHEVVERIARHTVDPYAGMQATLQDINAKYLARTLRIRCQTVREAIPLQTSLRFSVQNCAIAHGVWHVAITAYFINSVGCLSAPFTPGHLNHAAVTAAKVAPIELMPKCWMLLSNVHTAGCLTRHHGPVLPSAALWENMNEWR